MKIEWNENGFSAKIENEVTPTPQSQMKTAWSYLQENGAAILGSIAFISALVNLIFGLFLNFSTDILTSLGGDSATHWMVVLLVFSIILLSLSVLSGIFSIICYVKSRKKVFDHIGLILAIISFVVGFAGLILNIIGLIVW